MIDTIELRDLFYARQRLKCFDLNAEPAIAIADFDMLGQGPSGVVCFEVGRVDSSRANGREFGPRYDLTSFVDAAYLGRHYATLASLHRSHNCRIVLWCNSDVSIQPDASA